MSAPQLQLFEAPKMLRDRPALVSAPSAISITGRDYQTRGFNANVEAWKTHRSILDVMATGTGKTVLFAMHARAVGCALVIAHETSLIEQAAQKLRHVTGEYVAIEKAERRAWTDARFIVASMQTLRGDRLKAFAAANQHIKLLVIDEAHRALAKSYRDIIAAFPNAKVLGVTATADRGDKKALALVFEKVGDDADHGAAFKYDILAATRDGWLTPGDWIPLNVDGVSLDSVGLKGADLDQDQLDQAVVAVAAQCARGMFEAAKGRKSIGFCPGVASATVTAEALNRLQPGCARVIHGELPDDEKRQIKAAHFRGEFPYLLNCAMLIEGYDDARLECVFTFTKTKSRARWAQMYGRGTRLWPAGIDHLLTPEDRLAAIAASPKPRWAFYDANYGKHGHTLAGPFDLLAGSYDEEVKERAKKNLEATGGDVTAALEGAAAELEAERKKKLARLAAKAAAAKGQVLIGQARAACELFGVSTEMGVEDFHHGEPLEQVRAWLEIKGVTNASTMGLSPARALKKKLVERQRLGFATFKMVRALKKAGHPRAETLKFEEAGRLMGIVSAQYDRGNWSFKFPLEQIAAWQDRQPGEEG